jgi:hypothetical protein
MSDSLEAAVKDFLALLDGPGKVAINGQVIQGDGGYSQEQFDEALDRVRGCLPSEEDADDEVPDEPVADGDVGELGGSQPNKESDSA